MERLRKQELALARQFEILKALYDDLGLASVTISGSSYSGAEFHFGVASGFEEMMGLASLLQWSTGAGAVSEGLGVFELLVPGSFGAPLLFKALGRRALAEGAEAIAKESSERAIREAAEETVDTCCTFGACGLDDTTSGIIGSIHAPTGLPGGSAGTFFRRKSNVGNFAKLKVPMQMRYVRQAAAEAGVGLRGVKVKIVRDSDLIGTGIFGMTDEGGKVIRLLPDAFQDLETLVKTLGHERTHVLQRRIFGRETDAGFMIQMEDAAYGIESEFWKCYMQNRSGKLERFR